MIRSHKKQDGRCNIIMNILLVGKNSFIASNLALMLKQYHNVDHISYTMIDDVQDIYDIIINLI